jgi:NAD(P)-dependent dehydrogenase (short-subunit alcohol dehydrogenase family)
MTRSIALDVAKHKIRCNAINPGCKHQENIEEEGQLANVSGLSRYSDRHLRGYHFQYDYQVSTRRETSIEWSGKAGGYCQDGGGPGQR